MTMRPTNDKLMKILGEGLQDAVERQLKNDADRVFAGRMSVRLTWAMERIRELETEQYRAQYRASEESWRSNPDRMGGQFTDEEVARFHRDRESW